MPRILSVGETDVSPTGPLPSRLTRLRATWLRPGKPGCAERALDDGSASPGGEDLSQRHEFGYLEAQCVRAGGREALPPILRGLHVRVEDGAVVPRLCRRLERGSERERLDLALHVVDHPERAAHVLRRDQERVDLRDGRDLRAVREIACELREQ